MAEHCGPRHCEGPAPPEAPCGTGLPKPCMQPSSPNCISPRTGSPEPGTEPPSPTETSPRTGSPKPCTKLPSPTWISPRTGSPKPCTELRSPTDELAQTLYEAAQPHLNQTADGLAVGGHDVLLVRVHDAVALRAAQVVLPHRVRVSPGRQAWRVMRQVWRTMRQAARTQRLTLTVSGT